MFHSLILIVATSFVALGDSASSRGNDSSSARPPPIRNYAISTAFRVTGSASPGTILWRWQHPSERPGESWDPVRPASVVATVAVSSERAFAPRGGWVSVPSPLRHQLVGLQVVTQDKRVLPESEYQIWRSRRSRAYAVRFEAESGRDVRLNAAFARDLVSRPPLLPVLSTHQWRDLALSLQAAGERFLAEQMLSAKSFDGHELNRFVAKLTRYSYHPEKAVSDGPGDFGDLTQFLNDDGRLCFQCSHAARYLLFRMLRRAYVDYPEYEFRVSRFLLQDFDRLILPTHEGVEVFWRDLVLSNLDPTPEIFDPRAPTSDHLAKNANDAQLADLRRKLDASLPEITGRAEAVWPRELSAHSPVSRVLREAPLFRLIRLAQRLSAGENVRPSEFERERHNLRQWVQTPEVPNERYDLLRVFMAATRADAEYLVEQIDGVMRRSKCGLYLSQSAANDSPRISSH